MIIEFTKDHPAGITKGTVKELDAKFSQKMIDEGFAKESNQTDLDNFRKSLQDATQAKLVELQTKEAETLKAKQEAATIKTKEEDCGCGDTPKEEGEEECEECKKKAAAKKTIGAGTRKRTTKKTTTKKK